MDKVSPDEIRDLVKRLIEEKLISSTSIAATTFENVAMQIELQDRLIAAEADIHVLQMDQRAAGRSTGATCA